VKITLFTSNSPRHLSLAEGLSAIADEVFVVHECVTAFPGQVEDFFRRSEVMQRYFGRVVAAEQTVFGQARFLPDNVRQLPLRMGDLSLMPMERLGAALEMQPEAPFARPRLTYRPGGPVLPDELAAALREGRPRDLAAGRTLTGPHRDEIEVVMAGKNQPAAECSTGEQKAMLIATILAHSGMLERAEHMAGNAGGQPRARVLLLDEVAAHLDPVRREALFSRLREGRGQVWLTGTEPAPFAAILAEAAVWHVREGTLKRME